jgi:hypothetical protein
VRWERGNAVTALNLMVLKVLKVLNFPGTGKKGIFAEENGMPAMSWVWASRRFSGRVTGIWKSRGMIALHRTSDAIEVGESNAG